MNVNVFITLDGHIISVFVIACFESWDNSTKDDKYLIVLTVLLISECMCVAIVIFCNVSQQS